MHWNNFYIAKNKILLISKKFLAQNIWQHITSKKIQRNRSLLREIENTNQLSFFPTDVLRVHKGIAQEFKFKARNQNAHDIDPAMNSMRNTLYKLIRNNRNNPTQKISIGITEHFSKPKDVLNDKDLVDPVTGIIQKQVPGADTAFQRG